MRKNESKNGVKKKSKKQKNIVSKESRVKKMG